MVANTVTDLVVNQYIRQPVPRNPEGMNVYLSGQLQEIENSMKTVGEGSLQVVDQAPSRPLKGMLRYAVTPWDPLASGFQGLVVYSGSAWLRASDPEGSLATLEGTVTTLSSNLSTNYSTTVTTNAAIASATTGLASTSYVTSALGSYTNTATLNSNFYTKTDADTAIATADTALSTTVGNTYATITNTTASIDGIEAKNTVKIDNNGHISGYGLISTANTGTPTATFSVAADAFKIGNPASASTVTPFSVYTTSRTVDGVTVPAGTYIENAYITAANIKTLNADTITAGNLSASRLTLDGSTITANGSGQLIVADGGVATDKIAAAAVSTSDVYTYSDATITAHTYYTNIIDKLITGVTVGGQVLCHVDGWVDGLASGDPFAGFILDTGGDWQSISSPGGTVRYAARRVGVRASSGDTNWAIPFSIGVTTTATYGNVQVLFAGMNQRYNSTTTAGPTVYFRDLTLTVTRLKR